MATSRHKASKVSVVIFNYNGKYLLDKCISSVLSQGYRDFDLFMLDNGSTDGSADYVRKNYPSVNIIRIEKNNGIAEAQDTAYRAMKTPYVVSLHNDTICRPGWLSGLVKAMDDADKDVAAIESGIIQPDGKPLFGISNIMLTNSLLKSRMELIYPATCCMIFRNHILDRYGDPDYYFYYDDLYFGWLFRLAGYRIFRTEDAWIDHLGTRSESTMEIKKKNQFYNERNRILTFFTFFSAGTIIKLLPLLVFYTGVTVVGVSKKNGWKVMPWLKAYGWLLTHPHVISRKRIWVQKHRRVPDSAILPFMSCALPSFMGKLAKIYCKTLRINCYELAGW